MAADDFQKGLGLGPQEVGDVSDEAATVIELSGVIKWFDVSKGYGFIVPDNGGADILLHVTCLRRDGFQTAYEGARVVAEVLSVLPRPVDGRVDGDPSLDVAAGPHPRHCDADQRARAGDGEVVQPAPRLRLPDPRRGHPGHLRPHGDAAPLRPRRTSTRPDRAGAVRARPEGSDGGRGAAG